MKKNLKNKLILVTAGPTWVPIDRVRVISNISSGQTGSLIAREAKKQGARVKLLLGPGTFGLTKGIQTRRFHYFDDLYNLMQAELKKNRYDIVIHSAAVSDYHPVKKHLKKVPSKKKNFTIKLKSTRKIIKEIKKWNPEVFLVQFKLEVNKSIKKLIEMSYKSMITNKSDLVIANDIAKITSNSHEALIVDRKKNVTRVHTKNELTKQLLHKIGQVIK